MHEGRDVSSEIELRVEPHGPLGPLELGPGEQRQAQLDVGGVQCVGGPLELGAERLSRIEPARLRNQRLRECRIEAPIASFVGFGQR